MIGAELARAPETGGAHWHRSRPGRRTAPGPQKEICRYQRNSGLNYAKVPFLGGRPRARRAVPQPPGKRRPDRVPLVFITPRIANRGRALGQ